MKEKDFKEEELRNRLVDIHMKLASLEQKKGDPSYDELMKEARAELTEVRHELTRYKMKKLEEQKGMKR